MDDTTGIHQPKKPVADRAREIWLPRKGLQARKLASLLVEEGYDPVQPALIRQWIAGWEEFEAHLAAEGTKIPPEAIASVELLTNAKANLLTTDLDLIRDGMREMMTCCNAIAQEVIKRLPNISIDTAEDIQALTASMATMADAAGRLRVSAQEILRFRLDESTNDSGDAIYGEIIPPNHNRHADPRVNAALEALGIK